MPRALVLGGTGQVGVAVARRLLAAGWDVDLTGRNPPRLEVEGARFIRSDRTSADDLRAAFASGADLLVDNVCYTAEQARLVLPFAAEANATVMLSSKAVYVDAVGKHTNSDVRPRFDGPIPETQPTMAPGDMPHDSRQGYGGQRRLENPVSQNTDEAGMATFAGRIRKAFNSQPMLQKQREH